MLLDQLMLGSFMVALTVVLHGFALDRLIYLLECNKLKFIRTINGITMKIGVMSLIVSYVFFSHAVQIWLWGMCYQKIGALPDLEEALYFSTAVFTISGEFSLSTS